MMIGGWAADVQQGAPVARIELYIDRLHVADGLLGLARPDVEQYFHRDDFANSGWQVEIPLHQLTDGYHYLEIWNVDRDGTSHLLLERYLQCRPSSP
jgi:hypothetical protein